MTAKASVIVVLDWLPCCLGEIRSVKKQTVDNASLAFYSGSWRPPACFGMNATLPDCDQYIDEYYSTSTSTCDDCLFYDVLPEIVYQDYLISND